MTEVMNIYIQASLVAKTFVSGTPTPQANIIWYDMSRLVANKVKHNISTNKKKQKHVETRKTS